MSKLAEHNYIEWHRSKDETDTIRDIFWTHPIAVHLLQTFFCVLLMDCTYKTNRYCLPSLEIVGITSTDYIFSIALYILR